MTQEGPPSAAPTTLARRRALLAHVQAVALAAADQSDAQGHPRLAARLRAALTPHEDPSP